MPASVPVETSRAHVRTDVRSALRLLRSASIREFMLTPPPLSTELTLLTTARPNFTITTVEEQRGALQGRIALHYLGIPSFSDSEGLSGGLVVTSYADRTHPLHAPTVMADVRVGRYVRDNQTGDWCFLTRNDRDKLTRLQYVRVRNDVARERICLTCSTPLFDAGDIIGSVLFQCHDREFRTCQYCCSIPCTCRRKFTPMRIRALADAASSVGADGSASWRGKVRVTVLNDNNIGLDAYMDVTSSYEPTLDVTLARDMKYLALNEKVISNTCIPAPLEPASNDSSTVEAAKDEQRFQRIVKSEDVPLSQNDATHNQIVDDFNSVFLNESFEVADHFLVSNPPAISAEELDEVAMLPADPSVLPGGVEMCLDGFDFNEVEEPAKSMKRPRSEELEESLVSDDVETQSLRSVSSTLSIAGSDCPPMLCSVPPPCSSDKRAKGEVDQICSPVSQSDVPGVPDPFLLPDAVPSPETQEIPPIVLPATAAMQPVPPASVAVRSIPVQAPQPVIIPIPAPVKTTIPEPVKSMPAVQPKQHIAVVPKMEAIAVPAMSQAAMPYVQAPRLAPRPAGMNVDGFVWQMGSYAGNQLAIAARLEAMEKERKAEERRKKNRQAAARSNARKKDLMDGIKAQIREARSRVDELEKKRTILKEENQRLMAQIRAIQ